MTDSLFNCLGITNTKKEIQNLANDLGINYDRLSYLNKHNKLPDDDELAKIEDQLKISRLQIMLALGVYNNELIQLLQNHYKEIADIIKNRNSDVMNENSFSEVLTTDFGKLFQGDCLQVMSMIESNTIDLIFADPPFNLDKMYLSGVDDNLPEEQYIKWCEAWISDCIRILKPGGSFFLWNIPKWHAIISKFLNDRLTFRNWIAVDIKYSLPISGKLYPSHYSLVYFTKGEKPNVFHPDRMPMDVCKSCYREIKDYGGYKDKMNPKGINLSDVWFDIPPVRHSKYKKRKEANELSIKLLDRIIEMSSNEGDTVFDPFGGSGTTYVVSELKKRKWLGVELGPTSGIVDRLTNLDEERHFLTEFRKDYNKLFTEKVKRQRVERGLWVEETFHNLFD